MLHRGKGGYTYNYVLKQGDYVQSNDCEKRKLLIT